MENWLESYGLIVFILFIIAIILLKVVITGISNWRFDKKIKKFELHKLNEIVKKGYPWAKISQKITDFYGTKNSPYVAATKEAVQCIGVLPNRHAIYKTELGKFFEYYDKDLSSVIVDVAGNVYQDCVNRLDYARMVDKRLVITNNKQLVIPNNFYIINDPQEAKDFLDFRSCLASYFDFQYGDGMILYAKIIDNNRIEQNLFKE